jgi:CubicO group peptidase (beta-lactamase class C family)/uncharacterized Tic20 family protein
MTRTVLICWLAVVLAAPALAQGRQQSVERLTSHSLPREPFGRKELEAFFDPFFNKHVAQSAFPGAEVVLVKDGQVLFEKGYGYTDFQKRKPVSADRTVFYAASVSKLFVATAIMQLAERGKLNLNDDVNKYLSGFQLETKFGRPVTIANLLTHTGGLDEHLLRTESPISEPRMSMRAYFSKYTPPRILPPGDQINYSNHGMALAGYIVENVSGMPFYAYAEKNIFAPLEMHRSGFRQPLPRDLAADIGLRRFDLAYLVPYPAGTLATSAEDMGHFMMAHLNGGKLGRGRILGEETVAEMHRQHFTSHPKMPGVAYGFFESFTNARRGLFHTGARDHQSLLYLLPEENLGIYIVLSGTDAEGALCAEVLQAFLDRYYPSPRKAFFRNPSAAPPAILRARLERLIGTYRVNLVSRTTIEKLAALGMEARVTKDAQGPLMLSLPGLERAGRTTELVQVEPLFFRTSDGSFVAFRADKGGRVTNMFMSGGTSDPMSFEKLAWYESGRVHLGLIIGGFSGFALFLLTSLVGGLVLRKKRRSERASLGERGPETLNSSRSARMAWAAGTLVSVLVILSPTSAIVTAMLTKEHQLYSIPAILYFPLGCLLAASITGLLLPFFAVLAWIRSYWSLPARLAFTALSLISLVMAPVMNYWNLLGFRF